ncbi:MAG: hypothetical protein II467_00560 [Bacilli bacterium]|nr:hypothetical protein [Bacilli bacterium]
MLKKLISWHIKKWWPLLLIITLLTVIPFVSNIQAMNLYRNPSYNSSYGGNTLFLLSVFIPIMIATFVLPIFVYIFRTSLQAVDCFYQAGYEKKTITRVRVLIGLAILLISFTIAFLFGYITLVLRYVSSPDVITSPYNPDAEMAKIYLNFGYIFLFYVFFLVVLTGQYFINCFFVSLGDNIISQIFLMILGAVITTLFLASPYAYIYLSLVRNGLTINSVSGQFALIGAGPIQSMAALFLLMASPIERGYFEFSPEFGCYFIIFSLIIHSVFSVLSAVYVMFTSVPSGEHAGRSTPRNWAITIIPHLGALLLAILFALTGYVASGIISIFSIGGYLFFVTAYYALLSLLRKSFKPKPLDLIALMCVAATGLLFVIMSNALGITIY